MKEGKVTKKQIFNDRAELRIPDKARASLWGDAVFEWFFGDGDALEYEEFLEEERRLRTELYLIGRDVIAEEQARAISNQFFDHIESLYPVMYGDLNGMLEADPAARSRVEIITAYPGFYAVVMYRIAHRLWQSGAMLMARLLAEYVHSRTGIDIHPAADIGERFVIDHGTGVVIGETTTIGHDVKVYQGVTLGALSVSKKESGRKRHPTIGNHVVIYANATILGGETTIGDYGVIGGNVWITRSVPAESLVYHKSEIVIKASQKDELPEPINFVI